MLIDLLSSVLYFAQNFIAKVQSSLCASLVHLVYIDVGVDLL